MKIKFLLLIAFCLLGLCISQEMDPEMNEVEEQEEIERSQIIQDIFYQSKEEDRQDGQELIQLFEREKLNGGQCFLDVIEQIQEQYFNWYEKELSCFKKVCKITSKIPSAHEYGLCTQHCNYYFQKGGSYINELKYTIEPCLENYEQTQTKSNNNNIKYDEDKSSHSDNNNNNKNSQQNPSQKENQKTASSSKSDSDNQSIENSENLRNEKTFSCILSFLFIGINIVLF